MAVSALESSLPTYQPPELFAPVGDATLDRQDFMTLFITQLQYQDPLKPMDSYEMASQLAQFSNMEATMQMADNMEKLLEFQTSQNNLQLLTLIDRNVEAMGNGMGVAGGVASPTSFTLVEPAELCLVNIYDAAGHIVRTIDLGYADAGKHTLEWDGKDDNGNPVADGLYTYRVDAVSPAGNQVEVDYRTRGKVTAIGFENGTATVTVDSYATVNVSDITVVD